MRSGNRNRKLVGMDEKTFLNPEKAAADLLRMCAEKSGGTFPKRLDDPNEFDKIFPKPAQAGAIPDAQTFKFVQSITRFMMAAGAQGRVWLQVRWGQDG